MVDAVAAENLDLPEPTVGEVSMDNRLKGPVAVSLAVIDDLVTALPSSGPRPVWARGFRRGGTLVARLDEPIAYFIPEHVDDPSRRAPGEELWVEVTLPGSGAPRPIRLGVKKNGVLTPLDVR
jgi:hypothetical protein